jgi:hypothetical protein
VLLLVNFLTNGRLLLSSFNTTIGVEQYLLNRSPRLQLTVPGSAAGRQLDDAMAVAHWKTVSRAAGAMNGFSETR